MTRQVRVLHADDRGVAPVEVFERLVDLLVHPAGAGRCVDDDGLAVEPAGSFELVDRELRASGRGRRRLLADIHANRFDGVIGEVVDLLGARRCTDELTAAKAQVAPADRRAGATGLQRRGGRLGLIPVDAQVGGGEDRVGHLDDVVEHDVIDHDDEKDKGQREGECDGDPVREPHLVTALLEVSADEAEGPYEGRDEGADRDRDGENQGVLPPGLRLDAERVPGPFLIGEALGEGEDRDNCRGHEQGTPDRDLEPVRDVGADVKVPQASLDEVGEEVARDGTDAADESLHHPGPREQ